MSCLCRPNSASIQQRKDMISPTGDIQKLRKMKAKLELQVTHVNKMFSPNEAVQGGPQRNQAEKWLNDVKIILNEIDAIDRKVKIAKSALSCFLPNCCSRSDLGQHISEMIKEVSTLLEDAGKFSDISLTLPVSEMGMELPTREPVGETTAQKTIKMIWESLMDEESEMIGVYGMGGVGKTTIMKVINNRLLKEHQGFNKVIWVTITKEANIRRLQDVIAKEIGLYISHVQAEAERSSLLHEQLRSMGRIVFILDDMWEAIPLHKIGIPGSNKDTGSKLVLTSRSLEVCQEMGCKKEIKVELLAEEEAWDLFIRTVDVTLAPEVENIARDVAEECSRLPLAILIIGGAMRGKEDIREWRGALNDLKDSTYWIVDLEEKVIERLKFSYNKMGDEFMKKCFLHCALYPEDFQINPEELVDHWVMEGLINGRSIEDELDRGHDFLNNLKRRSMLEDDSEYDDEGVFRDYIKMHDLIRDMALHITKVNPHFLVKAGVSVEKLGDEMEWVEDCEKVSFMRSSLREIRTSPYCPGVRTLLLNGNPSLRHIAHGLFVQMQGLRVLNLRSTGIEELPESISDLINLHVLDLSWCERLKRVHSLEKLHSLSVLRLTFTAMEELPSGMEALDNLKRLDLTDTKFKEVPACLISKFSLLQELLMPTLQLSGFHGKELLSLSYLESLSIIFPSLSDYICYSRSENFRRLSYFSFAVGEPNYINIPKSYQNRSRGVSLCNVSHQISANILLPRKAEYLNLEEFDEVTRLSELARSNDMRELKSCKIENCNGMEHVLVSEEECYLQHLEKLEILSCTKLLSLYKGVSSQGLLCLKKLDIVLCHNLNYLFSFNLLKQLQNLVEVDINYCDKIEQLIVVFKEEGTGTNDVSITSSSLKLLKVMRLAKLKTLFPLSVLDYFQKLEEISLKRCEGMEELMAEEELVTSEGSKTRSNNTSIVFPSIKKLQLKDLHRLKSIWMGCLPHLEELDIADCPNLITLYKGVPTCNSLPCLKKLVISKCDTLTYLFSSKLFKQLQNLVEVEIESCYNMEQLIVTSEEEETTGEGEVINAFRTCCLKKLDLLTLPKLKTLFSKSVSHYFQNLEEVRIVCCNSMEDLIAAEEIMPSEGSLTSCDNTTIALPRLKTLYLSCLPKLKSIWKGVMVCDSLQTVEIHACDELKWLPKLNGQDRFPPPSLTKIKGYKKWWDSLECDHSYLQNHFHCIL